MSRAITDGEIKALFRQLVKAAGGVEAAAVELGCKHQRVSLLQSVGAPDLPNLRQILTLEAIVGRAILTGAAARAIEGECDDSITLALVESVQAAAEAIGITTDLMMDVLDGVAFDRPQPPAAPAAARKTEPAPTPAPDAGRAADVEPAAADAAAKVKPGGRRHAKPRDASSVLGADYLTPEGRLRKASPPRAVEHPKPRPGEVPERPLPAPRFPSERPKPRPVRVQAVMTRVKAVSADIARWAGWFLAADWDLNDVAELFEVDADSLADRLEGMAG